MTRPADVDGAAAEGRDADEAAENKSVLSSSAFMAAGTIVSRTSGLVRNALLAAALGAYLHADLFNIANTIPNMLYILLAGGIFNAVLVPQLVRAMRNDADGGEAYTNRIITLAGLFLAGVTAVLVLTAPWLMRIFLSADFFEPDLSAQRESVIRFAQYCLPQVFFYGMFTLVGQVLNSRGKFGPMMWAPIANNVISVIVLLTYLFMFGPASDNATGGYSTGQELVLGLGSTLGIAVQLLVLIPFLRAAGFRYRPRFDFRGTGLSHTLRLGVWTVMFVIVNQIAYTVVVRLASEGASTGLDGANPGTGYTIYSQTFLLVMVPHSIATVSLATAILPRLSAYAADHDLAGVARGVSSTMRSALTLIIPFALLLPLIAYDVANIAYGWLAAAEAFPDYVLPMSLFAIGLVFFTVHYLMLRGYYSLERTHTAFWVQCVVAATNISLAIWFTWLLSPEYTAAGLVLAYSGSYAVGALLSYALLRHLLGGLQTPVLLRFLVRLLTAAGIATVLSGTMRYVVEATLWPLDDGKIQAIVMLLLTAGLDVVLFLVLARLLRINEVTTVMELVAARLPGRLRRRANL